MDPLMRELLNASPSMWRLVLALAGDEHLANDLVQETWVAALRRRSDPPRDPARWARRVIRHLLHGTRLRDQRRREQEALAAEARTTPAPDQALAQQSFLQVIARAAQELDEPYRTVIRLRYWEDLSPPEIAARLGRPHDTVKTQLRRGLETLRERLDREHGDDRKAWLAPLRITLDPLGLEPTAAGLPLGGLLAAAAAVPVIAWLGWTFLGQEPRAASPASQASRVRAESSAAALPTAAAGRVVAPPVRAVPEAPVPSPERTSPRLAITVVDDLGRAVPAAEVFVLDREDGARMRGTTDASGALELPVEESELGAAGEPGLEDRVTLTAYRSGHAAPPWFLVRCAPASTTSLSIELPGPELVLEGPVTDAAGGPIEGAEVEVISRNRVRRSDGDLLIEDGLAILERSDAAGWFRVRGLQPGVHTLAVRAPGRVALERTVDGRAGGLVECALRLAEAGSVVGIVRDERGDPLPGARLTYELPVFNRLGPHEVHAGPDGSYRIGELPPGRLLLCAQDPQGTGLLARAWVEVVLESSVSWDPALERVEGVRVRVVDEDGAGLAGWQVSFYERDVKWSRLVATDADGRAAVFDLPPDRAVHVAVRRGPLDRFPRAGSTGLGPSAEELQLVVSRSDPAGSLGGSVVTEQGLPPADAAVWLFRDGHGDFEPIDASTGAFGFEGLPDGAYELMILWGGHGKLGLGRVELAGGERLDRGSTTLPATGRVLIDWSWPERAPGAELHFRLLHAPPNGLAAVVLKGPAPPPAHLDLLPGTYALVLEGEQVPPLSFQVESGRELRVASAPPPAPR